MALRTHNVPSGRHKNDFGEVDESTFQGSERPYEVIFCMLSIEKSDLDEAGEWPRDLIIFRLNVFNCDFVDVDEAMFHDVERPLERILYVVGIHKSVFDEAEVVLSRLMALRTHNLFSEHVNTIRTGHLNC
jgi:hypothetical protein